MRCAECGNDNRPGARFCDGCGAELAGAPAAGRQAGPAGETTARERPADAELKPLPSDAPASVGGGRFELAGFLGEGTRKRVFVARDSERDGVLVAVATFSTEGMAATAQARARREVEAMEKLGEHPHTVAVLASGEDGRRPFVASEYMAGGDLGDLLESAPQRRLEIGRALEIAADIAAGLEHAHSRGIVHRDIKPANIWLDSGSRARLGDFGLATDARSQAAIERMVVGTAAYLPPEQAIGRRTDERADLYSLGALLHEMLTGEPPFGGEDPVSIISRHLSAKPVPPSRRNPEVPPALDRLIAKLLAKSPDDRPGSASEVLAELRAIDPEDRAEGTDRPGREGDDPLDALAGGLFVGREREFEQLRELFELALEGRGGTALIEGEPGIGKTRLVEELVTYARVRGATVLASACHEADEVPAYWPFSEAIRSYIRDGDPVGLAWQLGADGPELSRLVPELAEMVPSIEPAGSLQGDQSRFRFFEAVAGFLVGIARSKPLVLVIDDLHWADSSSLELVRFLAHRLGGTRLLVVCAYRTEEAESGGRLGGAAAELAELTNSRRLSLAGLDRGAIGRYLELATASASAANAALAGGEELVEEIHEQTGGNPFFVGEVVRLIATEGSGGGSGRAGRRSIPSGVREAVARRVARLTDAAVETLEVAAVRGREFDGELLAGVLGRVVEEDLLAALSARIVERRGGDQYLFAHAVFREALYDSLGAGRRLQLHERIGLALEERCRGDTDPHVQALARHFGRAGATHADKALEYSIAAAGQAAAQLAHADAAGYLERALELLPADDSAARIELRLKLADELTRCGRFADARRMLWETVPIAERDEDPVAIAELALALGVLTETGSVDTDLVTLLERAIEGLGDGRATTRARLLATLSTELLWEGLEGRCEDAGREAIELARASGDDATLASVLAVRQFIDVARPGTNEIRLQNGREMVALARRAGDRRSEILGLAYECTALLQAADVEGADRTLAEYEKLARRLGEPRHIWHVPVIKATRAMMEGRLAEARALSEEGRRLGELAEEPLATQFHAIQMGVLHTHEGSPEEMLPLIRRMVDAYPAIGAWRLVLISFLADAERLEEARQEYEPLAARGFDQFPRDANWLVGIARVGEAAARLGDADVCRELIGELEGFAGELVIVGRAASCNGPVERVLGLMSAAIGEHDRAVELLEASLAIDERTGERTIRAETRGQLGRILLERDGEGDRNRAFEVLSLALEEGQEIGMRKLVERAVRLRLEAQGVAGVDAGASIDSVALAVAGERPDLLSFASADGRVTILFSDIENSTLMTERLGDRRWIEVLREHNAIFRRRLAEHDGYEVKNQGDGFMLAFPDPVAALECALAVQRDLTAHESTDDARVRVRMGMHVGEVIEEEGDFFGRSVILAARIAAQARGGEVLVSEALSEAARGSIELGEDRELELKGLAGTHRVFRAEWERAGAPA